MMEKRCLNPRFHVSVPLQRSSILHIARYLILHLGLIYLLDTSYFPPNAIDRESTMSFDISKAQTPLSLLFKFKRNLDSGMIRYMLAIYPIHIMPYHKQDLYSYKVEPPYRGSFQNRLWWQHLSIIMNNFII